MDLEVVKMAPTPTEMLLWIFGKAYHTTHTQQK